MSVVTRKSADPLWISKLAGKTPMDEYRRHINEAFSQDLRTSQDLHRWSVSDPQTFWVDLYQWLDLVPRLPPAAIAYDARLPMSSNPPFFPAVKHFNFAENSMFANPNPNAIALIGLRDDTDLDTSDGEKLTWSQFRDKVRLTASALRIHGIKKGDRVAALVATSIWAMVLFHASASIGAIFTSISPELGLEGCISRLQQVSPSILFADSHTMYKGKAVRIAAKIEHIVARLAPQPALYLIPIEPVTEDYNTVDDFLKKADPSAPLTFTRVPFNYPLIICYSSGTTGAPKCIVHHHGIVIQFKKVAKLHNSTTVDDVIFQYSSTSWIVFFIMTGYFGCGATTIVYNGSPMHPKKTQLLRMVEKYRVTYFGTSPRYLLELEMAKVVPKRDFDVSSLRIVYVTGAPLSADQYRWFYQAFPADAQLCNTAGGTDIASSLLAGDPCGSVHPGEMQIFALGMDIDIVHPTTGESILLTGEAGEMIVRQPFPSMPCFFWGDRDGSKYKSAYFERFTNIDVWAQHDWLQYNPQTGGLVMHGRSDGVLNPSGVRFGSGEIYSIVEAAPFTELVSNSLCVGRRRPQDQDEDVFLFVVMNAGQVFSPQLVQSLRQAIATGLSPRHVPKFVLEVPEIPATINGKKVEAAVKQVISGKDVNPSNTVVNPDAIRYFARFRDLEREPRHAKL